MENNIYQAEVDKLIEVGNYIYKQLGQGCQEDVYKEVLELELELRNIPYSRNKKLDSNTQEKSESFVCFDKILVELNTHLFLSEDQENVFKNSLTDVDPPLGLLFNFGNKKLQYVKVFEQCVFQ
ncbi:GxxExxY protein [Ancylomarina sp. 16SWW S1-10-2]|uniref:GxxExxY protein n=1 Tax=Ancylomarina sp. 16SWW S1-10-2 TaxID=2499681 RepID=UPI0012AE6C81|nr:GxxExxY protein [Ancylomarina sp. 16SWW S1-10-2]MRT93443.1 GxxExxY protein [Ancylomarina sp. 16SWW S1-10-2]